MTTNPRLRPSALRIAGLLLSTAIFFNASATAVFLVSRSLGENLESAIRRAKIQGRAYTDAPISPRAMVGSVGRSEHFRGGIKNARDLDDLLSAENSRLIEFAKLHPEVLEANTNPDPSAYALAGSAVVVGSEDTGEALGGADTRVSFLSRHESSLSPTRNDVANATGNWSRGSGGSPSFSNTGRGQTLSMGTPSPLDPPDPRIDPCATGQLNTNTGNFVTTVPITGWSSKGDSYIDFTLVHNSRYSSTLGAITDLAHSWSHSYSISVNYQVVDGNWIPAIGKTLYLIWMDGQRIKFTYGGTHGPGGFQFDSPSGYHAKVFYVANGGFTLKTKDSWTYVFNPAGYLVSQTDAWGNQVTVNRNANNEITSVNDGLNRFLTFSYVGGKISSVQAPDGKVWQFVSLNNNLTEVRYPQLNFTTYKTLFAYNASNDITTYTDTLGRSWSYTFDQSSVATSGRLQLSTNPLGKTWFTYYAATFTRAYSPTGAFVQHSYNDGKLISVMDEAGFVTNLWGDADNNLTQVQDPRGKTWNWTYDTFGNVLTFRDPTLLQWTFTYNAQHNLTTVKDPQNSTVTTIGYSLGTSTLPSPTLIDDPVYSPNGMVIYSSTGEVVSVGIDHPGSQPDEILATITYDSYKNVLQVSDQAGITTSATYDIMGRALTSTDATGQTSTVSYDDWGRPWQVRLPDNTTVRVNIDAAGQVVSATDQLNRTGSLAYNAAGYVTSATNAKNETHTFGYDVADRLTTVTNARGKVRTYEYTIRDEVRKLTQPDGSFESWAFNGNGDVSSYTNQLGQVIGFAYSDAGDPTLVDYPVGVDTSFAYDNRGRFVSMSDATGVTSWAYNLAGQVTSLATPQGAFSYAFNSLGQPLTMTDVSGVWTTLYDTYHRARGLTNPWGETTTVQFDSAGRVNRKDLPNGMYETYGFDVRSRLSSIQTFNSSNVLQDTKSYGWDAASRVLSATEGGVTSVYGYDAIDQLTSETKAALSYSATYTYDANGNRLSRTVNGVGETYAYDNADKLLSVVGGGDPRTFTYDLAGRTKTIVRPSGTTTLNYDFDGQVTSIIYPTATSDSFAYNGAGARVSSSGANGSKTFRRAGASVTSPVMSDGTKTYTPGVSSREGGASTFQHSGLKNTTDQTNSSQTVTASKHYDAFGNLISSSGTWQGPFGYGGGAGYQEDTNGLKLLGHRYYDPSTARFLTQDPIGDGKNWYVYCGNSTISLFDNDGMRAKSVGRGNLGSSSETGWPDIYDVSNFLAGYGDTLSFGGSKLGRRWVGGALSVGDANDIIDYDSGAYHAGELAGTVHDIAMGGAAGWAKGGAKGAGKSFSHFIPNKKLKQWGKKWVDWGNTKWNGNYVPNWRHGKHDNWYRPLGSKVKQKWPRVFQGLDRFPRVYVGAGGGAIAANLEVDGG